MLLYNMENCLGSFSWRGKKVFKNDTPLGSDKWDSIGLRWASGCYFFFRKNTLPLFFPNLYTMFYWGTSIFPSHNFWWELSLCRLRLVYVSWIKWTAEDAGNNILFNSLLFLVNSFSSSLLSLLGGGLGVILVLSILKKSKWSCY